MSDIETEILATKLIPPNELDELLKTTTDPLVRRLLLSHAKVYRAIWPGLPHWEPTPEHPQQDFHEAVLQSLHEPDEPVPPLEATDHANMEHLMRRLTKEAARFSYTEILADLGISDEEYDRIKAIWKERLGITPYV